MNRQNKVSLTMSILLNIALIVALFAIVSSYRNEVEGLNAKLTQYELAQQMIDSASDSDVSDFDTVALDTSSDTVDEEEMTTTTAKPTATAPTAAKPTTPTAAKPTTPPTTAAAGDNDGGWVEGWY